MTMWSYMIIQRWSYWRNWQSCGVCNFVLILRVFVEDCARRVSVLGGRHAHLEICFLLGPLLMVSIKTMGAWTYMWIGAKIARPLDWAEVVERLWVEFLYIHIRLGEALPTTLEAPVVVHEAALLILWVEPHPQPCCLLEQYKLCVTWPWPKLKWIVRNDGEETREGWRKRTKIGVNKRQNRGGGWERGSDGICTVQMISMKVKHHNRLGHQLRVCIMSHTSHWSSRGWQNLWLI